MFFQSIRHNPLVLRPQVPSCKSVCVCVYGGGGGAVGVRVERGKTKLMKMTELLRLNVFFVYLYVNAQPSKELSIVVSAYMMHLQWYSWSMYDLKRHTERTAVPLKEQHTGWVFCYIEYTSVFIVSKSYICDVERWLDFDDVVNN